MTIRTWRIPDIEKALKDEFGDIAIIMLSDMAFFSYYNNHFDGYWFAIHHNNSHRNIQGIIIEGMDEVDDKPFHIECAPYEFAIYTKREQ